MAQKNLQSYSLNQVSLEQAVLLACSEIISFARALQFFHLAPIKKPAPCLAIEVENGAILLWAQKTLPKNYKNFLVMLLLKKKSLYFLLFLQKKVKHKSIMKKILLPIQLPRQGIGHYACGEKGLMLFLKNKYTIAQDAPLFSGDLIENNQPNKVAKQKIDAKTSAIIIDL